MHNLKFDVEAAKAQLTQVFRDRLSAQGSVFNVQNVEIDAVMFEDLEEKTSGQDAAIAAMKAALAQARKDALLWSNGVQPQLTAIPQAAINYATLWNQSIPPLRTILGMPSPDREAVRALLEGLRSSTADQIATLSGVKSALDDLRTAVDADAAKFSTQFAPFRTLESLDLENIGAARKAIAHLAETIAELSEDIDEDLITAESDLALASSAIKAGSKGGNNGKALGVTVSVIFIVSASKAIDALIEAVEERLAAAQKEAATEVELSSLSAQFIALETASRALVALVNEIDDLHQSLQQTLAGWQQDSDRLTAILGDIDGDAAIGTILDPFDLGIAQGQWDELGAFATSWQSVEISVRATTEFIFDDTGDDTGGETATQPAAFILHAVPRTA